MEINENELLKKNIQRQFSVIHQLIFHPTDQPAYICTEIFKHLILCCMKRACKHFTSNVLITLACEFHTTIEKQIITV